MVRGRRRANTIALGSSAADLLAASLSPVHSSALSPGLVRRVSSSSSLQEPGPDSPIRRTMGGQRRRSTLFASTTTFSTAAFLSAMSKNEPRAMTGQMSGSDPSANDAFAYEENSPTSPNRARPCEEEDSLFRVRTPLTLEPLSSAKPSVTADCQEAATRARTPLVLEPLTPAKPSVAGDEPASPARSRGAHLLEPLTPAKPAVIFDEPKRTSLSKEQSSEKHQAVTPSIARDQTRTQEAGSHPSKQKHDIDSSASPVPTSPALSLPELSSEYDPTLGDSFMQSKMKMALEVGAKSLEAKRKRDEEILKKKEESRQKLRYQDWDGSFVQFKREQAEQKIDHVREVLSKPRLREALDTLTEFVMSRSESLAEIFQEFDLDGNGTLSQSELRQALRNLGVSLNPLELSAICRAFDEDGNDAIDFHEFETLLLDHSRNMAEKCAPPPKDDVLHGFQVGERIKSGLAIQSQGEKATGVVIGPGSTRKTIQVQFDSGNVFDLLPRQVVRVS
eukprot:TRINITY_DN37481_c0_g1_i2.p1 TRINITY_DN37481_c0_g1~~TRINITY_DN37481_c0_g1_i2.p1  ORF type:complete len:586 (-),score=69.47 TRINITY_DN37481_c0_g1_i2:210-1727(-)